jgi:hypothetical protein
VSEKLTAYWSVSLDTECPVCEESFDMLCTPDFWEGKSNWQLCEHATEKTEGVDACCPKCGHEFNVDLKY